MTILHIRITIIITTIRITLTIPTICRPMTITTLREAKMKANIILENSPLMDGKSGCFIPTKIDFKTFEANYA
jgi:hypothetical protein